MQMLVTADYPGARRAQADTGMPLMKQWGLAGFLDEARNAYMEEGIQTKYLRARMMWDAGLNVKAVLDDYYAHWYGAAAAPARAFWKTSRTAWRRPPCSVTRIACCPSPTLPSCWRSWEIERIGGGEAGRRRPQKMHVRATGSSSST